jgi:hypothetical protein
MEATDRCGRVARLALRSTPKFDWCRTSNTYIGGRGDRPTDLRQTIVWGSIDVVPMLLTALCAVSLGPLRRGTWGEIQAPLASVIIFGLISSTALNMLVVQPRAMHCIDVALRCGAGLAQGMQAMTPRCIEVVRDLTR